MRLSLPERRQLERAATLHWFHWLVIALSFTATIAAWSYAVEQTQQRSRERFERESEHVITLISERMRRYEDALWAAVAFHRVTEQVSLDGWSDYTRSVDLFQKYPGINGLGVVYRVHREELETYLAEQRLGRPDFELYPWREREVYYPVTYIEPVEGNQEAVGFDMAYESNRLETARLARDTASAQLTGPITLVQDQEGTPGFLFFAPMYEGSRAPLLTERKDRFVGLVYAPFVVRNLMQGTLDRKNRQVCLRISDRGEELYSEHSAQKRNFDPSPLFRREAAVSFYGRVWKFDLYSSKAFRREATTRLPLTILLAGLIIDAMLIALFVLISKANRRALTYADCVTAELQDRAAELRRSNRELEQFAYVASHDLQQPIRMVRSFADLLGNEYAGQLDERGERWLGFLVDGARRMQALVTDLLAYSRVSQAKLCCGAADTQAALEAALLDLGPAIKERGAEVIQVDPLPRVVGEEGQIRLVFQNLIANALKFTPGGESPRVTIKAAQEGDRCVVSVEDQGIGLEPEFTERIFQIFQRLHTEQEYAGTGLGLAICKTVVERHGGDIWVESELGRGATFKFSLKLAKAA